MATPIPAFVSQWIATSDDYVIVDTQSSFTGTVWYYFLSNRVAASNGQSLLRAVKNMLDAATSGYTWTVSLNSSFIVTLLQSGGGTPNVLFSDSLRVALGFDT